MGAKRGSMLEIGLNICKIGKNVDYIHLLIWRISYVLTIKNDKKGFPQKWIRNLIKCYAKAY
jgi:hypothetical protein